MNGPYRLPPAAKLAYLAWMLVWVPLYWSANGPANFLWVCDFANFVILAALVAESALLASSQLVGVLFIQTLWAVDFFGALVSGKHPIGGTEYMFDPASPLWLRALSLFHLWTLPLLVWMVRRLGYDARGWKLQTGFAALLFPAGMLFGTRAENLNWMWAPFGVPQTLVPPPLFALAAVPIAGFALFWTGHVVSRRWLARAAPVVDQS